MTTSAKGPQRTECGARNEVLRLTCNNDAGHAGAHFQQDSNGLRAWGFRYEAEEADRG